MSYIYYESTGLDFLTVVNEQSAGCESADAVVGVGVA